MKLKVQKTKFLYITVVIFIGILIGRIAIHFEASAYDILLYIYTAILILPLILNVFLRKFDLFEIINFIIAGNLIFFVLPGILYLHSQEILSISPINKALIYLITGIIAFYIGYYTRLGILIGKKLPAIYKDCLNSSKVYFVLLLGFLISLISFFLFAKLAGGVLYVITHIGERRFFSEGKHYLGLGMWIGIICSLFYYYYLRLNNKKINIIFLMYSLITVGLVTLKGGRSGLLTFLLAIICIHYYFTKNKRKIILPVMSFIIIGIFFFLWYGEQRYYIGKRFINPIEFLSHSKNFVVEIAGGGVNMLDRFAWVIEEIPNRFDLLWGKPFLGFFTLPIPRIIFPEKLNTPMTELNTILRPEYAAGVAGTTFTFSIFGELYSNWHIPGIIIGMFIIGVLSRSFYIWFKNCKKSMLPIYSLSLFPVFFLFRDGLSASVIVWLENFIIAILILLFCRGKGYGKV